MKPPTSVDRRRRYVDPDLQGGLILGLVLLQAVLVACVLLWLHADLEVLLEARLYRVHQAPGGSMAELLLSRGAPALAIMLVADAALLALAERFWARRLGRIAADLAHLARRTGHLDFQQDPPPPTDHAVITRARAWRRKEAARLAEFRVLARGLGRMPEPARGAHLARMAELLARDPAPGARPVDRD